MLFSTLVLITVERKHDRLQQSVDFRQTNQTTQDGNVSWLAL